MSGDFEQRRAEYRRATWEACPPEAWGEIVKGVVADAQGDGEQAERARRWLASYGPDLTSPGGATVTIRVVIENKTKGEVIDNERED